jgi:soluble lytic murein transglycosylase-like protein
MKKFALPVLGVYALAAYGVASHPELRYLYLVPAKLTVTVPSIPAQPFTLSEVIRGASLMHGVKRPIVQSIIAAESGFRPGLVSPKGAIGLMQLMPATAAELGADPHVPEQNVEAGTHYLSKLQTRYHRYRDGMVRMIAAYNAGPGNVDKYHGVPPFKETQNYVRRVLAFYKVFSAQGNS